MFECACVCVDTIHSQIILKSFSVFFFHAIHIIQHTRADTAHTYTQAYEELEDLLAKNNICIAVKEKLVKDSGVAEEIAYDSIVQKLLTKPRARGKCFFFSLLLLFL